MTSPQFKAHFKIALLQGKKITPMSALKTWGCFRAAVYINRLRNDGMDIITDIIRNPDGTSYAVYSLNIKKKTKLKAV